MELNPFAMKAEYLHVLLNPYPTHGIPLLLAALVLGIVVKSRATCRVALFLLLLCGAMTYAVVELGEVGYDRISAKADDAGTAWLDEHEDRAKKFAWVFYLTAGVSAAALVAAGLKSSAEKPLTYLAVLVAGAASATGGYIAYAGGKVTHPEFRTEAPPVPATKTEAVKDND